MMGFVRTLLEMAFWWLSLLTVSLLHDAALMAKLSVNNARVLMEFAYGQEQVLAFLFGGLLVLLCLRVALCQKPKRDSKGRFKRG